MNNQPRRVLRELVAEHGHELCESRKYRVCRDLLRGRCGAFPEEIKLLIEAQASEGAEELLTLPAGTDAAALLDRLTGKLRLAYGMSEADARWAVEGWAMALGIIPMPEPPAAEPPPPAPEPPPPPAPPPTELLDDPLRF